MFQVHTNGARGYKVQHGDDDRYIVRMEKVMLICKKWDLIGIPFEHAIVVIIIKRWKVEEFISIWYNKRKFERTYALSIEPMNGPKYWPITGKPAITTPKKKKNAW